MFEFPKDFEWLAPWLPLGDESDALEGGAILAELESGETIAASLTAELTREMPDGHILKNCQLRAVGKCDADPNEFLFVTDSETAPLAVVHLTWRAEKDPTWPFTDGYRTIDDWVAQMRKEHIGYTKQSTRKSG